MGLVMETGEIDIRKVMGLLRRQLRLILITAAIVMAVAIGYVLVVNPIYSATTLVLVDPQSSNLLQPETGTAAPMLDTGRIDSEVEILRSDNILLKVIQAENLVADANLGASLSLSERLMTFLRLAEPKPRTGAETLSQIITQLRGAISIQRRGNTYLIAVQANSPDPDQSARLANALAGVYIADQLESKISNVMAARDVMQARMEAARNAIVSSEGAFDAFIAENLAQISRDTGRLDLTAMQGQINDLAQARAGLSTTLTELQDAIASDNWDAIVAGLQMDAANELQQQRQSLANRIAGTTDQSEVVNLQAELARLETQLRETATREASSIRADITNNQSREDTLRQDLRTTVISSNLSADVLAQIFELQQSASLARSQYQTMLARTQELATQANLQVADSRIVSPALVPQSPSFPNPRVILTVAAILALLVGVALAFVYENYIGGLTSDEQALAVLKTSAALSIPRAKGSSPALSLADLVAEAPLSGFSEAIRRTRATIDQLQRQHPLEGGMVIMVTSTAPNEGKSTVALALARSYALAGRTTLLVDCDLRKPTIHRQLGVERSHGLFEFLSQEGSGDLMAITSVDEVSGATVVVGAHHSDMPTDQLLAGKSFASLMNAARKTFEVTIIDTPPIGPVVDGLYLAPFTDSIVFVTHWARTSQADARRAIMNLDAVKAPNAEIISVLNQRVESRPNYHKRYGGYYEQPSKA
jgi:succinoglycan biosynthesis transport protein ExoP